MADADAPKPKKNADLPVRVASALVMLAVAGAALWLGGKWFDAFVWVIAAVTLGEFFRLVWLSTSSSAWRMVGLVFVSAYVAAAAYSLAHLPLAVVLGIIAVVVATDVGAYFSGRTIGGPKIAPRVSPSKTWAGLIGGATLAGLVSFGFFFSNVGERSFSAMGAFAFVTGALLAVLAQAGDFFESWLKRKSGLKDSSNLIPGHGGVLDRMDGLIPVAIAGWLLWTGLHPA